MALTLEDGTGIEGAEAYQSVADTEAQLGTLGYFGFAGLADDPAKEAVLRRATQAVDRSLRAAPDGDPVNLRQGLYYPRTKEFISDRSELSSEVVAYAVPPDALLASSLKAELLALEESGSAAEVPEGVLSVRLAKGVGVTTDGRVLDSPERRNLRAAVRDTIAGLRPGAELGWAW